MGLKSHFFFFFSTNTCCAGRGISQVEEVETLIGNKSSSKEMGFSIN